MTETGEKGMTHEAGIEAASNEYDACWQQSKSVGIADLEAAERIIQAYLSASGMVLVPREATTGTLAWEKGTYVSTDDDNGPMEGIPVELKAWRAGPYTIIRQRSKDGLFLLRGHSSGLGLMASRLSEAKAAAQEDYDARSQSALA